MVGFPLLSAYRMEGDRTELEVRGTPVFMRLRRTLPMVTMRPEREQSQWENA
jgi:hypothetical protein